MSQSITKWLYTSKLWKQALGKHFKDLAGNFCSVINRLSEGKKLIYEQAQSFIFTTWNFLHLHIHFLKSISHLFISVLFEKTGIFSPSSYFYARISYFLDIFLFWLESVLFVFFYIQYTWEEFTSTLNFATLTFREYFPFRLKCTKNKFCTVTQTILYNVI